MKRPSMYNRHEASLKAFVEKFNNVKDNLRLVMQIYNTENFRGDGVIVDTKTGKSVTDILNQGNFHLKNWDNLNEN